MNILLLEPRKALNKAFLKIKPNRTHIEDFKTNLIQILDSINEKESEEFHKNLVINFLKKTYYDPNYSVNTKGRNDLVIHNGKDAKTNVGVIIEAKSPSNKNEMITVANLNGKALQELVLYYMRERITHKNTELKHLVVTNIYEWFVFDAQLFNKVFAENKAFTKQFTDFEEGRLSGKTTDYFYKEIAKPFIESVQNTIEFAHFDIRKYDKPLRNVNKEDDKLLVALFKLLSPEHLLKLSFANDSNSLDKNFYSELLHIIGLTEVKEGGKKLIERHKAGKRNSGSLLENAIEQLDSLDKISRLQNPKQYGETTDERLFTVALELTITWVNRILFLKLLEAQLITYHKGDKSYSFLNSDLIKDYDNLNSLFFQVLAKKPAERNDRVATAFAKVPYLNSSLFEPTDLEHETLFISQLEDNNTLPLLPATVIKDNQGKKNTGTKKALDYFFSFLDAYDFASEGSEDIQEDNKTLINASVLGLIFEKINGYKDGSFFTPSFITMYMCKETIRRAVVQKFSPLAPNGDMFENFDDLKSFCFHHYKKEDKAKFNAVINQIKICDPAVGSGHFLVSALNEIIAIKNELGILVDKDGLQLKTDVEVVNDELMITDEDGIPFSYNPNNKESQRIQETLFHEKQTIIENCLFGVDINPNSVKICRLRLWIELLKNAYYRHSESAIKSTSPNGHAASGGELETLPNIDINIKCGNSLISRFGLDADLKKALKQSKWNIESYKLAVATYRNAESKEQKREMERLIGDIKSNFRSEIGINDPKKLKLEKLKGELFNYTQQVGLFERSKKEQTEWNKKVNVLGTDINTLDTEIEEIKSNKIYENAFEWRFEFPDVLNDNGDYVGFDVVIGNPPYVFTREADFTDMYKNVVADFLNKNEVMTESKGLNVQTGKINLFGIFLIRSFDLLKKGAEVNFIIPNNILRATTYEAIRNFILSNTEIVEIVDLGSNIFHDATVATVIFSFRKETKFEIHKTKVITDITNFETKKFNTVFLDQTLFKKNTSYIFNILLKPEEYGIIDKMENKSNRLEFFFKNISPGIDGDKEKYVRKTKENESFKPLLFGKDFGRYVTNFNNNFIEYKREKLNRARDESIFLSKKILIQRISGGNMPLTATVDSKNFYTFNSVNNLILKDTVDMPIEFFAGLLNSKLLNWYYSLMFSNKSTLTVNISKTFLAELPIKVDVNENISLKVNEILSLKSQDSKADTQNLEQEIDIIVYELYGLTAEEIKIVENN